MIEEELEKLLRAGYIAKVVREEAARMAKPGLKLIELASYIESRIRELGGEPAFPVNLSVNSIAAHYTPLYGDESVIPENSVLKIDVGVHVDGYIADTATTVAFNPIYEGLVEATRKALERALEILKPGIKASEVGKVIEETVKSSGYRVVKNLSGHSMARYLIHAGHTIPNYNDVFNRSRLEKGVYAIEPFATNGYGIVVSGAATTIYAVKKHVQKHLPADARKLLDTIWAERKTLPFCERWYVKLFNDINALRNSIKILDGKNLLIKYPILIEKSNGIVSQHEHTVVISEKDIIVTTM